MKNLMPILLFTALGLLFLYQNAFFPWLPQDNKIFADASQKTRVNCPVPSKDTLILFTFGQSNAANSGGSRHSPHPHVIHYSYLDGHCYHANDPLLGTTKTRGSVWSRLGDLLIESQMASHVVFITAAYGGTSISDWQPNAYHGRRLRHIIKRLKQDNISPDYFLWHQGEEDSRRRTSETAYYQQFLIINQTLQDAFGEKPVLVAKASICHGSSQAVLSAQEKLAQKVGNIFSGPNTDTLTRPGDRSDGCHFSDQGLQAHAHLWLEALAPVLNPPE